VNACEFTNVYSRMCIYECVFTNVEHNIHECETHCSGMETHSFYLHALHSKSTFKLMQIEIANVNGNQF